MSLEHLTKLKEVGNELFKAKKYEEAISKFVEAIITMEGQANKEFLSKETEISKLYVICLVNASLACISSKKLENYDKVIEFCDKALSIDEKNVKGLYRRALARKEKAEILEREHGVQHEGLLELYEKSKNDFENLCLIDKSNDLAIKNLSSTIKDIYRVTVGRGEDVNFNSQSGSQGQKTNKEEKSPYDHHPEKPKRGLDMTKIMKEYKVEEVTSAVQDKVRSQYLTSELPQLRSELEKAIRTIEKSDETLLQFSYRLSEEYLLKIQPTFDTLSTLVNIIVRKGTGEESKRALLAFQKQKSWKLLLKSYLPVEKKSLESKWVEVGLAIETLYC